MLSPQLVLPRHPMQMAVLSDSLTVSGACRPKNRNILIFELVVLIYIAYS